MSHASTSPIPAGVSAAAQTAAMPTLLRALIEVPGRFTTWVAEQRRISRMVATLEDLNDHTLQDIGVERSDIRRFARDRVRR